MGGLLSVGTSDGAVAVIGATLMTGIAGIAVALIGRREKAPDRESNHAERLAILEHQADELDQRLDRAEQRLDALDRRWWGR